MTALKLLYVDDEPDLREIAGFAFDLDPEIELRTYPSGAAALAAMRAETWRPDGILLDVMMPDMDGPTTLQRLRQIGGLEVTPAIFITARAQPGERQSYLELGAIEVITKPFDPMTLAADIRSILSVS